MLHGDFCFKVRDDSQSAVRISSIFQYNCIDRYASKKYDPLGLFAPVLGLAFRRISLCRLAGILIGVGVMEAAKVDNTSNSRSTEKMDPEYRQSEYQHAKDFYDIPPPLGNNKYSTLSKQIEHAEQCVDLYRRWDNKWFPGHQDIKIQTWNNRINKLKSEHKRECTNKYYSNVPI